MERALRLRRGRQQGHDGQHVVEILVAGQIVIGDVVGQSGSPIHICIERLVGVEVRGVGLSGGRILGHAGVWFRCRSRSGGRHGNSVRIESAIQKVRLGDHPKADGFAVNIRAHIEHGQDVRSPADREGIKEVIALELRLRAAVQKVPFLTEKCRRNPLVHIQKAEVDRQVGIRTRRIRIHDIDHLRGGGIDLDREHSASGVEEPGRGRRTDVVESARGKRNRKGDIRNGLRLNLEIWHRQKDDAEREQNRTTCSTGSGEEQWLHKDC